MQKNSYSTIRTLMESTKIEELRQGLALARSEISRIGSNESKPLFEMVSTIFYIDPWDRPDLMPILDEAISLVVGFGEWVIPILVKNLDTTDIKAQFAIAQVLGRIGTDAIKPLMDEYESSVDPALRSFILYTLGKIKTPKIVQAAYIVIEAAQSDNLELRDTAIRAIGKFAESIPPSHLSEELHMGFIERLQTDLADPSTSIRAKVVRSLGKLSKYGHLTAPEREKLKELCRLFLDVDEEDYECWPYIIRKEAKEALKYV
ncbi:HEAT repeat domain-containing protein [Candidatus Latescibacterota bacterium]